MKTLFGAIDIGASSGRVIAAVFQNGKLTMNEVHRFPNAPKQAGDRLIWDFDELLSQVRFGLRELGARAEKMNLEVKSVGIDTWAVDYGLVSDGHLVTQPNCYRDPQNDLGVRLVHEKLSFSNLYKINGIQFLPFNSIYQISKHKELFPTEFAGAKHALMLPDLIGYFLTGKMMTERTNASSTGLLDATSREWSSEVADALGIDVSLFPKLANAGEELGVLKPGFGPRLAKTKVVLVGSHDTASAVVGVPAPQPNFAFISSGTWSLLGAEIAEPILSPESKDANFTNELGVDNRVRYLKNLSGLWLLSESIRFWNSLGQPQDLQQLLKDAASYSDPVILDVNDPSFIAPGDMPLKIARQLEAAGLRAPNSPAEYVAVILHSLAKQYAIALEELSELTGLQFDQLHVTGGGSQNQLLCELTAKYCKLEVIAGPIEATAIGNLLVQARAAGLTGSTLEELRKVILDSDFQLKRYKAKGS